MNAKQDKQGKVSPSKQKKIEAVKALTQKFEKSKSSVFADYSGLTHKQLEEFRKKIKNLEAEFTITKNRLLLRALKESKNAPEDTGEFKNPTATLFSYKDEVSALKELVAFFKSAGSGSIKRGLLDDKFLNEEEVIALSKLPGLDNLRAQVVSRLASPLTGLTNALSWNMRKLVWAFNKIQQKKSNVQN